MSPHIVVEEAMPMPLLSLLLMLEATPAAPGAFDFARVHPLARSAARPIDRPIDRTRLTSTAPCDTSRTSSDIVVCGERRDRYRLPLPIDRPVGDRARDLPGGMAALTSAAPCGIFAGQRRCSKAEARKYGYGGGRDPVTLLRKLATRAVDPDAD